MYKSKQLIENQFGKRDQPLRRMRMFEVYVLSSWFNEKCILVEAEVKRFLLLFVA